MNSHVYKWRLTTGPRLSIALLIILFFSFLILLVSCTGEKSGRRELASLASQPIRTLAEIEEQGVLRVVTRNGPTTYYENKEGEIEGLEYEMIQSFASSLGLKAEVVVENSLEGVLQRLASGHADLAAAGLSINETRQETFAFTSPYQSVQQQVVCRPGVTPKKIADLTDLLILVEERSSYADRLEALEQTGTSLNWQSEDQSTSEILDQLNRDKSDIDCTIADSHIVHLYIRFFPKTNVSMSLGEEEHLAWALRPENNELRERASIWIESARKQGLLASWINRYYGHITDFDPVDLKTFMSRVETHLPKYRHLFQAAERETGISWKLLAALSYQESHWNPKAKSPTGVRGMMMLTQNTARSLGVKNREDPEESILGGARYLKQLISEVSPYIAEEDRIWVALASYNVGAAHVRDARGLAAWRNEDPNRWSGIKKVLPLLEKQSVHWRLPHGYARGLEPVVFVRRVRHYYDLLE